MASALSELKEDIKELEKLLGSATRPKVKDVISIELRKLQTEYIKKDEALKQQNDNVGGDAAAVTAKPTVNVPPKKGYAKEIKTYGWDQSDKFMKIYITMKGVHQLDKSAITSKFDKRSFRVDVADLDGLNPYCAVTTLSEDIDPEASYCKAKTDMVLVMLKKKEEKKTWPYVTEREKKQKEKKPPKMDEGDDPSAGLMNMMKQMYDDGDDDMKRTIAKAWTESRDKSGGGMPPMM